MKKAFAAIAVLLVILTLAGVGYWYFFASMLCLPKGEPVASYASPYSDARLEVYRVDGGATTDTAIRGCVVYDNGKGKNIYWNYHESEADVQWLDAETVQINGTVLNIHHDVFDFRRQ